VQGKDYGDRKMRVITRQLNLKTKGTCDLINITEHIQEALDKSNLKEGAVTVFVVGSTAAITSFEYEPGLISDVKELYERIIPSTKPYAHDETWGDANGFSHLRSALQGPSLVIPFNSGRLILGTWQQIVLAEFDTRPRQRKIILQFMGE
jgi:secondary thiamine-phosphate synthase enzyme